VLKEAEQFLANKAFQDLLKLKIKELDFGPNHKKASELVKELTFVINDYINMKEQPEEYICEHFSKQRNNIDLAREKLILEINQLSDKLILDIDSQEKECKAKILKSHLPNTGDDLASIKSDLSKWEQDVRYLVVDENLWTSIKIKCNQHVEQLNQSRLEFGEILLGKPCELKTESYFSDTFIQQLTTYVKKCYSIFFNFR
jgi:hypothetical protein